MWCNPEDVRRVLGLENEVPDYKLEHFIEDAQREILDRIAIYEEADKLDGSINSWNTTFTYHHKYIADSNFDYEPDMRVYAWRKGTILGRLVVDTIDYDNQKVILYAAPSTNCTSITASYYYYPKYINTVRLRRVTALLAAYYYVLSEYLLIPEQWFHGAYRFRFDKAFDSIYNEFERELSNILRKEHYKGEFGTIEMFSGTIKTGKKVVEDEYEVDHI